MKWMGPWSKEYLHGHRWGLSTTWITSSLQAHQSPRCHAALEAGSNRPGRTTPPSVMGWACAGAARMGCPPHRLQRRPPLSMGN